MLKSFYIQEVKDATENQFKERTIAVKIGAVIEQLLGQLFSAHPDQLNFWTQDFIVPVTRSGKSSYALFPKRVIHFSDLKKGCRSINTEGDNSVQFVPVSLLGRKIYPTINTGDTSIGFEVKTDRVIFDNLPDEIKNVVLSLVIPFDQYLLTDDIPAPSGVNETIIQMTVQALTGKEVPINIHKSTPAQKIITQ